ncbi:MAG: D-alanyl-D-alanine carboxypeptidase, partial [Eubacterium sp.]|nr:D-alanyl-D-alanine carboxypeptidase [Eubacterium sp.]
VLNQSLYNNNPRASISDEIDYKNNLSDVNNLEYKELFSFVKKDGNSIKLYLKNNTVYITGSYPSVKSIKHMKELTVNSALSTKLLVNKYNPLPKDYSPKNLTVIDANKVKLEYSGLKLNSVTLNALYSMEAAAEKTGVKGFIVNSAYRSFTTQQLIFDANLNSFKKTSKTLDEAYEKTRLLVALPGNSEHHTGLSLDIFSVNGRHRSDFEGTREQGWLIKNLTNYGFIVRYPKDKTKETNSVYEPWHIRYVGIPLSSYMKKNNLCLEEFYSKLLSGQILENNNSAFMQIKKGRKVFIDSTLISKVSLEKVNEKNALLTLSFQGS